MLNIPFNGNSVLKENIGGEITWEEANEIWLWDVVWGIRVGIPGYNIYNNYSVD